MKQVIIKKGDVIVVDVPAPLAGYGEVLVQVSHSCVSIGTELAGMRVSGRPLWERALSQPDRVIKTLKMAASQGISSTRNVVQAQLGSYIPIGYSNAGVVVAIGEGVSNIVVDQRVACAGAQSAYHAEIISVPHNLLVPVPDQVDFQAASTVTMGAIALQGIRRAQPTLGEVFAIVGLGALGQLTTQMLKANGCRTIGLDVDPLRIEKAVQLGLDVGLDAQTDLSEVFRLSGGYGVDGVIVTAASSSDEVISSAFKMCRKKGRVVLVGDVGLSLKRADIYEKELDFLVSTSYGPGRYDQQYEEKGLDYPISYVRWTENRNMEEFLRLLAEEKVNVHELIGATHPVEKAPEVYRQLRDSDESPLLVLLEFPFKETISEFNRVIKSREKSLSPAPGIIKMAIIGVGNYCKAMHLPLLQSMARHYRISAIATRTGHNAAEIAERFLADYSTTDTRVVFDDTEINAVLIATRHNLHAGLVVEALGSGKHVLVEKPLATSRQEMRRIQEVVEKNSEPPVLMTGFNRNFSPFIDRLRALMPSQRGPMVINYRMNAGFIPADSWVHSEEGGGRNIGEACHIYALFTLLTGSTVKKVQAQCVQTTEDCYQNNDNFIATISFTDGSVATLIYTALGSSKLPKEHMELFVDGKVFVLDDYRSLTVYGGSEKGLSTKVPDKGQKAQLEQFARAVQGEINWPIPFWQQVQAMNIAFEVEQAFSGTEEELDGD